MLILVTTALALPVQTLPARASPATWRWPLDGRPRVLQQFAPPPEPWLAGHRGIDLAAPPKTPVVSAGAGTIRFAGAVGGRGVVTIDHPNGLRTTYLPVEPSVRRGQEVTAGTRLGVLATSELHCKESCLHWGLIRDGRYLNPLLLLRQALVRLLPFWEAPPVTALLPARALILQRSNSATSHRGVVTGPPPRPDLKRATSPPSAQHAATAHVPEEPSSEHSQQRIAATRSTSPTYVRREAARHETRKPSTANLRLIDWRTSNVLLSGWSASVPAAPAIGLGALLGTILVITTVRRARNLSSHRRTPPRHQHRRGRHRNRTQSRRRRPTRFPETK